MPPKDAFRAPGKLASLYDDSSIYRITYVNDLPVTDARKDGSLVRKWLKHPVATEVNRWVKEEFRPVGINETIQVDGSRVFNTWAGFGWEPLDGAPTIFKEDLLTVLKKRCPTIYEFLFVVIASERGDLVIYLMAWLADTVQNPRRPKNRCALIFKSEAEGNGKDSFAALALSLLPPENTLPTATVEDLIKFTSGLKDILLAVFSEFSYNQGSDSARVRNTSYILIDGDKMRYEAKGLSAEEDENNCRVIKTTNEPNPLPPGSKGRRYCVVEPSTIKVSDAEYWTKFHNVIADRSPGSEWHYFATICARLDLTKWETPKGAAPTPFAPQAHAPRYTTEQIEALEAAITGYAAIMREILDRGVLPFTETAVRAIDLETCGKRGKRDPFPWRKLVSELSTEFGRAVLGYAGTAYHVVEDDMRKFTEHHVLHGRKMEMSPTKHGTYLSYLSVAGGDYMDRNSGGERGRWWPELKVARRLFELMYTKGNAIAWSNDLESWSEAPKIRL